MRRIFVYCFFCFHALFASNNIYLHVNLHQYPCGMFSVFSYVAGVLYEYDKQDYAGIKIDFENMGLYYDSEHGPNWWQYYCKPICTEYRPENILKSFNLDEYVTYAYFLQRELSKFQVNDLIKKYIHIQDHILNKIDKFVNEHFLKSHIIAVHYRGTDKIAEAPRTSFAEVSSAVDKYIRQKRLKKYKIFIASDEADFVHFMRQKYGKSVITYSTYLSEDNTPLHLKLSNNYLHGEEAFIDCILLSKANVLIRTSSNLSLWSTYFNPNISVIALSERYGE